MRGAPGLLPAARLTSLDEARALKGAQMERAVRGRLAGALGDLARGDLAALRVVQDLEDPERVGERPAQHPRVAAAEPVLAQQRVRKESC